jgi:hypothetical protein
MRLSSFCSKIMHIVKDRRWSWGRNSGLKHVPGGALCCHSQSPICPIPHNDTSHTLARIGQVVVRKKEIDRAKDVYIILNMLYSFLGGVLCL